MENLYLFEILVKSFTFEPLDPFPEREFVKVEVTFSDFVLEIEPTGAENWPEESGGHLIYNFGKSIIFPSRPSKLIQQSQIPMELIVTDPFRSLGQIKIPWVNFGKMLNTKTIQEVEPCKIEGEFNLVVKDITCATINVFIRLSVYGQYIESKFFIKQDVFTNQTDYCFKNPNISKAVVCKKVHSEDCPINTKVFKDRLNKFDTKQDNVSWEALFKTNLEGRFSMTNPEFGRFISAVSAVSMINMGEKPNEKTVKEICEIIQRVIFDLDKEENPDIDVLTLEKIQQNLCGNRDCEWVKKFEEIGIKFDKNKYVEPCNGPNDQPRNYGLSKSFGMFELYGPESKYRRPKRINDSFSRPDKYC
ncbi:unnamed protein product [Brassicogethes aeneus]|uniref:Uncharacterized protein n=1 Tax=Brassicogethes aeneus TaxID=1431903 RepID=A0A9P0FC56_BRAAE|nr:unnamed protein product [Brassicogethes aeneus]